MKPMKRPHEKYCTIYRNVLFTARHNPVRMLHAQFRGRRFRGSIQTNVFSRRSQPLNRKYLTNNNMSKTVQDTMQRTLSHSLELAQIRSSMLQTILCVEAFSLFFVLYHSACMLGSSLMYLLFLLPYGTSDCTNRSI